MTDDIDQLLIAALMEDSRLSSRPWPKSAA